MPPTLPVPQPELISLLNAHYGVEPSAIIPLTIDRAPACMAATVETRSGRTFFLKFKRDISPGSIAVVSLLEARSIPVLAPLRSLLGESYIWADGFSLLLYPLLDAHPADEITLAPAQWRELGYILRRVHETPLPEPLLATLPHATFIPWGKLFLAECTDAFAHRGQSLRNLWDKQQRLVKEFFDFTQELGRSASLVAPSFRLCHNDFHSDNILVDASTGDLTVIDWDNSLWGLRERDLLFIAPENRPAFEVGYGMFEEVPEAVRYVHADWLLQDLLDCFGRLLSPKLGPLERAWVLESIADIVFRMRNFLERSQTSRSTDQPPS